VLQAPLLIGGSGVGSGGKDGVAGMLDVVVARELHDARGDVSCC
jgi:hypothetical protein